MTNGPTNRFAWLAVCILCAAFGCDRARASSGAEGATATSAAQTVGGKQAATKVTRIVFVGKEHACDCTRKKVDAGWAALQKALGTPPKVPVERLQYDTQADKVAPYRNQKPMMAMPGIYFVDDKNVVLELLQGEVTAEEITAVLRGKKPAP